MKLSHHWRDVLILSSARDKTCSSVLKQLEFIEVHVFDTEQQAVTVMRREVTKACTKRSVLVRSKIFLILPILYRPNDAV